MKKISRVGKIGKVGVVGAARGPRVEVVTGTGGGVEQLNVLPEQLREVARRIGDKRAKRVWKLRGRVEGTLPELCAYEWLERRKLVFEFQTSLMGGRRISGGAVVDFLIYGLSANGIYVWRIQGEYWHTMPGVEKKDEIQRIRMMKLKVGGIPVVGVVDIWESDVYDRYPECFEKAEMGVGLRGE